MSITWESIAKQRQALIDAAVKVPGCENPVTYDPTQQTTYGSWICNHCKLSAFGGEDFHGNDCQLKGKWKGEYVYRDPAMIYVIGPNDSGYYSPFDLHKIEEIKALAKANLPSS